MTDERGTKIGLGSLRLPLYRGQHYIVHGGPFRECPSNFRGVKMAKELQLDCVVDIPTKDYSTPDLLTLYRGVAKAVELIIAGEPLYVGCMGGMGRTGLFLAILAKTFGVKKPVEYVRANYYSHAVETADQFKFVKEFRPDPRTRAKIKKARKWAWVYFWRGNLTNLPKA